MLNKTASTLCSFPWEMYSADSGFGWWRPCPRIDYQPLNDKNYFNHDRLLELRKNLREGVKDKLCQRCWDDEDRGVKSYRQVLKQDLRPKHFAVDFVEVPKIFEIKFDHLCNLKCVFCNSRCSSLWEKEQPISKSEYGLLHGEDVGRDLLNFFKKHYATIETVQVFGGEPVLHKQFDEIIDILCAEKDAEASKELSLSTNLFFSRVRMDRFLSQIERVLGAGHVLYLRVSVDGVGEQGEYLRTGLKWKTVEENILLLSSVLGKFEKIGRVRCNIALNILNLTSLHTIMRFLSENGLGWIQPHYNYVGKPERFMLQSYGRRLLPALEMVSGQNFYGYNIYKEHILSLVGSMTDLEPDLTAISDCRMWLENYDKGRARKFLDVFPDNHFMFMDERS